MLIWVNGQPCDQISATDRGVAYGDGLFETIKVIDAKPLRLERHLQRLARGCKQLALPADITLIEGELKRFAGVLGQGVMKLTLTRGVGMRGYGLPAPTILTRIVQGGVLPAYPQPHAQEGISLFPCQTRLSQQPRLAGLKHLNRLEQVLARNEWSDPAYAEGLMCDSQNQVIEGVFSNLFIVKDGGLITPRLDQCGVAGVMRAEVLAKAQAAGIKAVEQVVALAVFLTADEVFFCNSLYGIWPVRRFADRQWSVGPVTRKLQALIDTPLD